MTPRSPAPSMRPPPIAPSPVSSVHLDAANWRPPCPGLDPWLMAPATMRAGYSESSNTRFRHYGHAAAWTGAPPASSPPASPEPPDRQVLTTVRASLGDRRSAEGAVREAFRLAAVRWDMMACCPPETKR